MLNVAIAVDSATDPGRHAALVVSAACEEVMGEGRCPVASTLGPGTVVAWYALVRPNDRGLSGLRIEFRDRTADGVLIEERALTFAARDGEDSRWASAGSVIAALVAAREGSLARPPRAPLGTPASRPRWSVDLAALYVPALGDGPSRWGGFGRAHVGLWGRSFAIASAGAAAHPGNPSFVWWMLSAGVGARVARLNLELGAELVYARTSVAVDGGGRHDSVGENGWGGRVSAVAVWATWRHCAVTFGVDGTVVLPRLDVDVGAQTAQRVPSATLGLALGLRLQP